MVETGSYIGCARPRSQLEGTDMRVRRALHLHAKEVSYGMLALKREHLKLYEGCCNNPRAKFKSHEDRLKCTAKNILSVCARGVSMKITIDFGPFFFPGVEK